MFRIKFQDNEYLLIGDDIETGGAIATQEEWDNFAENYAHLFRDGRILRYGAEIGTREDIEVLGYIDD